MDVEDFEVDYNFTNSTIYYYTNITHRQRELTASDFIYKFICPAMALTGIVGNSIAFVVLLRQPFKGFSVSVYLAAYCMTGFLQWIVNIGPDWLITMTESSYLRDFSDISCRLWQFLTHIVTFSGLWFLTGATIDRVIALWHPVKSQVMCTVFMAKNSLVFILIGITVVSIHAMWLFVLRDNHCEQERNDRYLGQYWSWAVALVLQLLPSLLLFFFGNMMFFRLCLKNQSIQLPDASQNEMDLTYVVMILSFLNFMFSMPLSVTNLLAIGYWTSGQHTLFLSSLQLPLEYSNYLMWGSYTCGIFVFCAYSKTFRTGIEDLMRGLVSCLSKDSSNIELQLMNGDYDQVPSTSTSV